MKRIAILLAFAFVVIGSPSIAQESKLERWKKKVHKFFSIDKEERDDDIQQVDVKDVDVKPELWNKIYEVFSHPRCVNCHVGPDNIPRWSGPSYGGKVKPHGMYINGGESRIGSETISCNACHTKRNAQIPHGPPGSPVWLLAPVEMQWLGKTSKQICEQIKNPERNGGRTLAEVADHVDHDALVHWGWNPGPGREPAPLSKDELVQLIKQWDAAGANCPDE